VPKADIHAFAIVEVSPFAHVPPRALRFYGCQPSNFAGAGVAHGDDYGSICPLPSALATPIGSMPC
jgi:hypothetical protein